MAIADNAKPKMLLSDAQNILTQLQDLLIVEFNRRNNPNSGEAMSLYITQDKALSTNPDETSKKLVLSEDIERILKGKERAKAGFLVPAKGLFLDKVEY